MQGKSRHLSPLWKQSWLDAVFSDQLTLEGYYWGSCQSWSHGCRTCIKRKKCIMVIFLVSDQKINFQAQEVLATCDWASAMWLPLFWSAFLGGAPCKYIFVHANQKIYHSTFFFSWCMFCTHVWCRLPQSNMWTYDIWRRDLTVFDRVLHLKEILSKMCSFRCCLLLPIIAGEVRALRADWARIRFCQRWQNTEPRMGDARLDPFGRSHADSADLLCPLLQNIC